MAMDTLNVKSKSFSIATVFGTQPSRSHDFLEKETSRISFDTARSRLREDTVAKNPFFLPENSDIFRLREEERTRKQKLAQTVAESRVETKSTFASRQQATFSSDALKTTFREAKTIRVPAYSDQLASKSWLKPRRRERENVREFIAKKREIFLVQMSLDTKRAEIKKLEDKAKQRDEALKKSEKMLEEDAVKFDTFLKENDEKVQEAIRKADNEARLKQEKVAEIKKLSNVLATNRSEVNKMEEKLEECKKYNEFIDAVTPADWFEKQALKAQQRREACLQAWQVGCQEIRAKKEAAHAGKVKAEQDYANARTQQEAERAERAIKESAATLREALALKEPPMPNLEELPTPNEEEMFFQTPDQLLQIYKELEGSNLFHIQHAQETEEALEELRIQCQETKELLSREVDSIRIHIRHVLNAIHVAKGYTNQLKEHTLNDSTALGTSDTPAAEQVTLEQLTAKVAEAFFRCGFDPDPSISPLQMLTNIECRFEDYLSAVSSLPKSSLEAAERLREKERRQQVREEKAGQAKLEHEERVKRAMERAAAPAFRKTGKPLMFRSQLPKKKEKVVEDKASDLEADLQAFLAKDMI